MTILTKEQEYARKVVEEIRVDNGGITEEDRAKTGAVVLRALQSVRSKWAASVETLARDLYSTDTRFVYELIQNADDNKYTGPNASSAFLRFTIGSNLVTIDSNEDGFTEKDVKAICSTGQSTKTGIQNCIGEKGIGFKSVFKVAKQVHVQSGAFSFRFEYTKASEDGGLGMVTPMDEKYNPLPTDVKTRIILTLIDDAKIDQTCRDLLDLPETVLLFLRKVKVIEIRHELADGGTTLIQYQRRTPGRSGTTIVSETVKSREENDFVEHHFRTIRHKVENLPGDESRPGVSETNVELAFPIDKDSEPDITSQQVFAFLPLLDAGFKFIIQADFVTQANREGVFHSPWNFRILEGVAEAFSKAVVDFCENDSLVHSWMKYLPDNTISDDFWKRLRPKIKALLSDRDIIRSRSEKGLYKLGRMRVLPSNFLDKKSEPLFQDLEDSEIYVSAEYDPGDVTTLESLGLQVIFWTELLDRVETDLNRTLSKYRHEKDQDWHTRVANLLCSAHSNEDRGYQFRVRKFELLPLRTGKWVSAAKCSPVYLPTIRHSEIPDDLHFNVILKSASENSARARLFWQLGVQSITSQQVVARIFELYSQIANPLWAPNRPDLHLRYLYDNLLEEVTDVRGRIWVMSEDSKRIRLSASSGQRMYFYLPQDPYGATSQLHNGCKDEKAELSHVHFMHAESAYHRDDVGKIRHGRTYKKWLEEVVGVREVIELRAPPVITLFREPTPKDELSGEFNYIMRYRPHHLAAVLQSRWEIYRESLRSGPKDNILDSLRNCRIPTEGGKWTILRKTHLPLPKLKAVVTSVAVQPEGLFIKLPEDLEDKDKAKWQFLDWFMVGTDDDVRFYLRTLSCIEHQCDRFRWDCILPLYGKIAERCLTPGNVQDTRQMFDTSRLICEPVEGTAEEHKWHYRSECVWSGPEWLTVKKRLDRIYECMEEFFCLTLKVPTSIRWQDCLKELQCLKATRLMNIDSAPKIYRHLMADFVHHSNWTELSEQFVKLELVHIPSQNVWCSPAACVWAKPQIRVPGKHSIATVYPELYDFFTRMLGVPLPDLRMHVQTLKDLSTVQTRDARWWTSIKDTMMLISDMNPDPGELKQLRNANIFPVKTSQGVVRPTNVQVEFAITDRPQYEQLFPGIAILDFSRQEVHAYRPFLSAMGLDKKLMSNLVEEHTSVAGGMLNTGLTDFFRARAYALFRIAVHYHSSKTRNDDRSLYHQLVHSETHGSDRISKALTMIQNGQLHTVEQQKGNFHMDESAARLRLYVPTHRNDRIVCYLRQLPRHLMTFLGITDASAEAMITTIVNSINLIVADEILREAGVVEVDGIERPRELDEDAEGGSEEANTRGATMKTSESGSNSGHATSVDDGPPTPQSVHSEEEELVITSASSAFQLRPSTAPPVGFHNQLTPAYAPPLPAIVPRNENAQYRTLLDRVIRAASEAVFPDYGHSDHSDILNASGEPILPIFTCRSPERDYKVGAAGELYVFELLSHLNLPGFSRANWQSTIRHEVKVHENYHNLDRWEGMETADITYNDTENELKDLLVENEYISEARASQINHAQYFIEVKTTTAEWDEPFYASERQYQRMRECGWRNGDAPRSIYVLMRVFAIESGSIGLRVYVDPLAAKARGELHFTADKWKVKPKTVQLD